MQRTVKPFKCEAPGCTWPNGFGTPNDLLRHQSSVHPGFNPTGALQKIYRCPVPGCNSRNKGYPRLDNFRNHLGRVHKHEDVQRLQAL